MTDKLDLEEMERLLYAAGMFSDSRKGGCTLTSADLDFYRGAFVFIPLAIARIRELEKQRDELKKALTIIAKGEPRIIGKTHYDRPGKQFARDALHASEENHLTDAPEKGQD